MMGESGYTTSIDQIDSSEWTHLLAKFEDASIYQSWVYGTIRWGERSLSHFVLKKHGKVCAIAQLRIVRVPLIGKGVAYLRWGPLWRLRNETYDISSLRHMLTFLRKEYVRKRGLLLRLIPNEEKRDDSILHLLYEGHGYMWKGSSYRTILLDLRPSLDALRKNLTSRWRRQLNISQRNELELAQGTEGELVTIFKRLYNEMVARKAYAPGLNADEFFEMQCFLPDQQKMQVLICKKDNKPVAGIVCSLFGDTAIYLLGATGNEGLKCRGSYLLHWKMIEWLKSGGVSWYDLSGYNPDKNPGTATFKEGFSGKDVQYIGVYESSGGIGNEMVVKAAEFIHTKVQRSRSRGRLRRCV